MPLLRNSKISSRTEKKTVGHRKTRDDAMKENYMISTKISHPCTFQVEMLTSRKTPARTFLEGRDYTPIEHFKDPETENVTVSHR